MRSDNTGIYLHYCEGGRDDATNVAASRILLDQLLLDPPLSWQARDRNGEWVWNALPSGPAVLYRMNSGTDKLLDYAPEQLLYDWPLLFVRNCPYVSLAKHRYAKAQDAVDDYPRIARGHSQLEKLAREYLLEDVPGVATAGQVERMQISVLAAAVFMWFGSDAWSRLSQTPELQ